MHVGDWDRRLRHALHPLDALPTGAPENAPQLRELFDLEHLREAAVLIGLVPRVDGPHVVLTVRHEGLRQHGGQVAFPGGAADPDDTDAVATALRETREELGLAARLITPLGALPPLGTRSGFRVVPIVAWIDAEAQFAPDPREVEAVFEVPFAALLDARHLGHVEIDAAGAPRRVLEYRLPAGVSPHRIWGATAIMLDMLRQRLETCP